MLKLYNTLTRKKEEFKPIKNQVGLYSCGPTCYWYQHIGNLRTYIFVDLLKRVLEYNKFKVKHVMNITDVGHLTSDKDEGEDKVEAAAKKEGKTAKEITNYYFKVFKKDFKKLNIKEPNFWPRATDHIKEQIELIKKLEKKGYTYKTKDGIYFDTSKFKDYGKFSKINIEEIEAGKRVSLKEKKHPTDFALWKFSKKPGERQQEWKTKWGVGYPGWHLECSAMSMKYLGEHFDIHTGGQEHIQIHHQNEIAQSEAATGKKFVNYWLHTGWLTSKGEKISKSKGGLYTISELQKKGFDPLAFRYLTLTAHYKKPLEFSLESLTAAQSAYERLKEKVQEIKRKKTSKGNTKKYQEKFLQAINDDLNVSKALAILQDLLRDNSLGSKQKYELIKNFDKVLGLDLDKIKKESIPSEITELAKKRETYRKKKDFKNSDKIREQIKKKGYLIEDSKYGYKLKKSN
ncbi:MAG: cysteine--tRNA ligase [Candidatus Woesearchaeota archaeon]